MDHAECVAAHAACAEPVTTPPRTKCGDIQSVLPAHDACTPMDAKAVGDAENGSCACVLGYAWNGTECTLLTDCFCEGADCNKLTMDHAECVAAHSSCSV